MKESISIEDLDFVLIIVSAIVTIALAFLFKKVLEKNIYNIKNHIIKSFIEGIITPIEIISDYWFDSDNIIQKIGIPLGIGVILAFGKAFHLLHYCWYLIYVLIAYSLILVFASIYDKKNKKYPLCI